MWMKMGCLLSLDLLKVSSSCPLWEFFLASVATGLLVRNTYISEYIKNDWTL